MPFIFIDSRVKKLTCLRQEDAKHRKYGSQFHGSVCWLFSSIPEMPTRQRKLCVGRHVFVGFGGAQICPPNRLRLIVIRPNRKTRRGSELRKGVCLCLRSDLFQNEW